MKNKPKICDFVNKELECFRRECNFTPEELEVFELKAKDKSRVDISLELCMSEKKVSAVTNSIIKKILKVL